MLDFKIKDSIRAEMAKEYRAVHVAISIIANRSFGCDNAPLCIANPEGGVIVNNREIRICKNFVMDDQNWSVIKSTPEERAVVDAIACITETVEKDGINALQFYEPHGYIKRPLIKMLNLE